MSRNIKAKVNRIRFNEDEPSCFPEKEKNIEDTAHKKAAEIAANSPIYPPIFKIDEYYHKVDL